jgi:hypothetical protein
MDRSAGAGYYSLTNYLSLNESISLTRFPHLFGQNLVDERLAWMTDDQVRSEADLSVAKTTG